MNSNHTSAGNPPDSTAGDPPTLQRLQRVLAQAGLGSRRACEELITAGRVTVDGQVASTLGTKVDPERQSIQVDGELVRMRRHVYYMLNKPAGVLSTNRDEAGRPRTIDLVPSDTRVYSVGRLDKSSEGLILLTNDGDLAQRLTHPRHGVTKTYLVRVVGQPTREQLNQLQSGVRLAEGIARVATVRVKKSQKNFSDLEMVLDEGRNREIRRVLAAIGHKVLTLRRIAIGPLRMGDLPSGASRRLEKAEIQALQRAAVGAGARTGSGTPSAARPRTGATRRPAAKFRGAKNPAAKSRLRPRARGSSPTRATRPGRSRRK